MLLGSCLSACRPHPLLLALEEQRFESIVQLLDEKPSLLHTAIGPRMRNAWHIASELGHLDVLKLLAVRTSAASEAAQQDKGRFTHLMSTLFQGCSKLDSMVGRRTTLGHTPLILAAMRGRDDCVEFLLSLGELGLSAAGENAPSHVQKSALSHPPTRKARCDLYEAKQVGGSFCMCIGNICTGTKCSNRPQPGALL